MFRILDRYLVREIVMPFFLGLAVLTFILEIPPILTQAEQFISRGVEWSIVIRVLGLLLPQALCLTIPMAVLGILWLRTVVGGSGIRRHAGVRRQFDASRQACAAGGWPGERSHRLRNHRRPAGREPELSRDRVRRWPHVWKATSVPVCSSRTSRQGDLRLELPPEGGWRDVFVADTARPSETTVLCA
jgi:hypothetical protein